LDTGRIWQAGHIYSGMPFKGMGEIKF